MTEMRRPIPARLRAPALLALAAALLCSCAAPRHGQDMKLGANSLNVAETALAGNQPDLAIHIADAVLKADPDNVAARLVHGDAAYLLGDCSEATSDYERALGKAPHSTDGELGLGRCALTSHPRAAARYFAQAARDNPHNAAAYNDLGIAHARRGEFAAAEAAFRKALAVDPSIRAARVNLGMALALGGEAGRAVTILGPVARDGKATPRIRADYATALVLAGDRTAAETVLRTDLPAAEAKAMVAQLAALAPGTDRAHDGSATAD